MPGFSKPDKHSLAFLNAVQFLGALNDNIYKLAVIFFIIRLEGAQNANYILSAAGAVFVIPFLLFSSAAGILADRMSKSRFIIGVKASEIVIMIFALFAFAFKIKLGSYALLFLLATQSAVFGPSKYGIIPELVPKTRVSKANGLITSFTYLAIIFGTFLASFITEITDYNFLVVGGVCLVAAIVGFLCSFGIKYTPPVGSKKRVNLLFVREIYRTLKACSNKKHLLVVISASAYFLFIAAFTQLNIIPFAIESLGLTEVAGGYLFLTTALGIAFGAFVAGRVSKKQIEIGLSCLAGFVISLTFFALALFQSSVIFAAIALVTLGFFGGNFVVPLDAFIQLFSPEENRGHVIAATNFLSFLGVLIASFAIIFLNQVVGLKGAVSFGVIGVITLGFTIFMSMRLFDHVMTYTSRRFGMRLARVKTSDQGIIQKSSNPVLILQEASPYKAFLLSGAVPNIKWLVPKEHLKKFPSLLYSVHSIQKHDHLEDLLNQEADHLEGEEVPCIYLKKRLPAKVKSGFSLADFFRTSHCQPIDVTFEKSPKKKTLTISFQKNIK